MSDITPPIVLVKTWLSLAYYSPDQDAKRHAEKMLINEFGSVELASLFAEEHGLRIGLH